MEPFKITCVSCRAVLTVRKESMIGQIIACPRCNMMVQVLPPAGHGSAASPVAKAPAHKGPSKPTVGEKSAASAAAAATLFESADAIADIAPPSAPRGDISSAGPIFAAFSVTFDDAVDTLSDPAKTAPTTAAPLVPSSTAVPPPPPGHLPAATSRWAALKLPAMIGGGAGAGAALVATALTLFSGDEPAPDVAANVPHSAPVAASPATVPTAVDVDVPQIAPADPPAAVVADSQTAAPPTTADAANISPAPEDLITGPPGIEDSTEPDAKLAEPSASEAAANVNPAAPDAAVEPAPAPAVPDSKEAAKVEQPKLVIDPLEIDPEGLSLTTLYSGPPKDPIAASQLPGEAEGVELSVPAPHEAPPDSSPAVEAPNAAGAVRRDEQGVGAPAGNVATLLARKMPEMKVQNMPLCRLIDLSAQLSGIPVSVAPDQLRLAAVSAGQPATADVKDATVEEFLAAALKPLRLQPVVVNDQIVLIRGNNNPRRSVTYSVDDLARDAAANEQLAATIQKVVAPESWESAGGTGTIVVDDKQLKIETGEAIQYDVLLLLERSRAALGLSPRSKYPAALIGYEAAPIALAQRLGAPATFTFSQYAPLREIFRHWQEEMQVAVLVDWPALADLRLWPNTRIACSSAGKPWEAALDEVLTPLGLAWRPIDKRTVEITTLEKGASAPLLEIYRLNREALAGVDDLATQINKLAASDENARNAPHGAVILDGEHGLLLVRQPATIQRQIAASLSKMGLLASSTPTNGE